MMMFWGIVFYLVVVDGLGVLVFGGGGDLVGKIFQVVKVYNSKGI